MRRTLFASALVPLVGLGLLLGPRATGVGLVRSAPTPPPTPVPPSGSPSPFPTSLETPEPSRDPPPIGAPSAALVDLSSGLVLYERGASERRPVASTTKVMTALIVLERTSPGDIVTASPRAASQRGSALGLEAGEQITVRDLLYALLLQSANDAAVALAEHVSGDVEAFVAAMNRRARRLGLEDTRFESPNGLDDRGFSTALDMARITAEAYGHDLFAKIVRTKFRTIPAPEGAPRRIQNRNALLWLYEGAIGVKTGFTSAAGFSLVAAAERDGLRLVSVVLGAEEEAFSDAAALLNYGFAAFELRTILEAGEPLDPVEVDGVEVPAAVGDDLLALIAANGEIVVRPRVASGLQLPVASGAELGVVEVSSGGRSLGSVPMLAAETVAAPRVVPPWWEDALDGVADSTSELLGSIF